MNRGRRRPLTKCCLAAAVAAALSSRAASGTPVPAKPSDSLVDTIGVNVHTWDGGSPYTSNWTGVAERIGEMGIRQVRDHGIGVDQLNYLTDNYGVKVDSIMQYPLGPQRSLSDLSVLDTMLNYAKQLHGLAWMEGPNEYGDSTQPQTISDLRTWTEQLKARASADPQLSSIPILAPSPFYQYQLLGDISAYVDYANMHSYTAGSYPSSTLANWINYAHLVAPNAPVISTEVGWHDETAGNDMQQTDELTVGKYIPRTFFEYFNAGVVKTYIYELVDDRPDPDETYGEGHFGLLNNDLSYKPSGLHTKNLISLLADPGPQFTPSSLDYTLTGGDADVHTTLLQKRDGRFYLAIWQEKQGYDNTTRNDIVVPDQSVTLTINGAPMMMRRYELDNVSAPLQASGSSTFQLNVPDQVMILELSTPQPGWNVNAGGNWSQSSNWASGGVPDAPGATANFLSTIGAADQTVTLDSPRTAGMINFWSNHQYIIAGSAALTMQSSSSVTQATINVLAGSHTIAAPMVLASDTTVDVDLAGSTLTLSGDMSGSGSLSKTGSGMLAVKDVRTAGNLSVLQGTLQVAPNATATGTSHIAQLSFAAGAKLDLTDNKLITASPAGSWTGSAYTGVTGLIQSGALTSSSRTSGLTTLAVASASDIGITTTSIWSGQTVSPSDTLVMYTYAGDANLDGKLNIDDYVKIDAGIAAGLTGWSNGDFNYDGKINIDDYTIIDSNLPIQGGPFDSGSSPITMVAIPEPTVPMGLLMALAYVARAPRPCRARKDQHGRGARATSQATAE